MYVHSVVQRNRPDGSRTDFYLDLVSASTKCTSGLRRCFLQKCQKHSALCRYVQERPKRDAALCQRSAFLTAGSVIEGCWRAYTSQPKRIHILLLAERVMSSDRAFEILWFFFSLLRVEKS